VPLIQSVSAPLEGVDVIKESQREALPLLYIISPSLIKGGGIKGEGYLINTYRD
ncbi:unnamed protein product, partial [marine sediment metagenome]